MVFVCYMAIYFDLLMMQRLYFVQRFLPNVESIIQKCIISISMDDDQDRSKEFPVFRNPKGVYETATIYKGFLSL